MLGRMELTSVGASPAATSVATAATAAPPAPAKTEAGGFAAALDGQRTVQQQRAALRDVLASMPPMVAEQIQRSVPGGKPPMGAVDALFKAVKSGEFVPNAEQLAAHTSVIGAAVRAADAFGSAEEMWQGMRDLLGSGAPLHDAVRAAAAEANHEPAPALISTKQQAEEILGGPLSTAQLNWWETALRFLIDHSKAGAGQSTLATTPAPAPKPTGGGGDRACCVCTSGHLAAGRAHRRRDACGERGDTRRAEDGRARVGRSPHPISQGLRPEGPLSPGTGRGERERMACGSSAEPHRPDTSRAGTAAPALCPSSVLRAASGCPSDPSARLPRLGCASARPSGRERGSRGG